jgi:hypothetical protein
LNFERRLDVEELGALIRSERGFEIVAAIMGDARPEWWRIVVPLMDAADARKMQIAARRRLEKTIESAVDADKHLTATIRRAEAVFRIRTTLARNLMRCAQWAAYRIAPWLRPIAFCSITLS